MARHQSQFASTRIQAILFLLLVTIMCSQAANGQNELHLSLLTDQIERPVWIASPPDDPTRLYVLNQHDGLGTGTVRIVKNGVLQSQPFMSVSPVANLVTTGLLCLAFAPDYSTSRTMYIFYVDDQWTITIERLNALPNGDAVDESTRDVIMTIAQPHYIHPGGWLGFGPDGYMYISIGDGGPSFDPDRRGQDLQSRLAKILRIDPGGDDFPADDSRDYAIPLSNPFVSTSPQDEIWAYGVRAPWRCSFDRLTGDFFIADVGQDDWEELNVQPALSTGGENYGWRCREGAHDAFLDPECDGATFTEPLLEYLNGADPPCAIIGGYVYRGSNRPDLAGRYVFGDYCTSRIWSARYEGGALVDLIEHCPIVVDQGLALGRISSFGEDACGELFVIDADDHVFRFVPELPISDCNLNGVEDGCETAMGVTTDLNANAIPDSCECLADSSGDSVVNVTDLLSLLGAWGPCGAPCPPDITFDGAVNVTDLLVLLGAWGACP